MRLLVHSLTLCVGLGWVATQASAQESKAAKATREKVKQVIAEIDLKEVGTKAFFEDVNRELDKPLNFKLDNTTGISNNTKISFKGKNLSVEKLLNELSDKYEFGWVIISNPENNKIDGWIIIRKGKGKERGYEFGKEPKKSASESPRQESPRLDRDAASVPRLIDVARLPSITVLTNRTRLTE